VAPAVGAAVGRLADRVVERAFRPGDVRGHVLAVAATDDAAVNRRVHSACRRRGIPVNVVDVPELCTFIVPAVLRRGALTIAISTGGLSPTLARTLKRRLDVLLPKSLGSLARELSRERRAAQRATPPGSGRMRLLRRLARERLGKAALP
jgi:siroheme synthase-like protein